MAETRNPNGASTIYQDRHGYWHGRVTVGIRDDGRPDRRHVGAKTRKDIVQSVRKLERERDAGRVARPGTNWTVETWLLHWLENIAAPRIRENSLSSYRVAIRKHLIPGVGAHRLDKLEPEHLERLYQKMINNGSAPATAHQAHRTIRAALNEAVRRGHIFRNPAALAHGPRLIEKEVQPYTVDEVRQVLEVAATRPNSARWALALALGLRQGEALGLKWSDIDLEAGTLTVRRSLNRPRWQHGCAAPCGRRPGYCPQRVMAREYAADTKSVAGRRVIGLPAALVTLLSKHREEQTSARITAGDLWQDNDWVFTGPTGAPLNPSTDYHEWKRLLKRAGLRDGRLHDARHTAATVLLILGVPGRVVMGLMGWANTAMAVRYQHLTESIRTDVAQRVDGLLWTGTNTPASSADDLSAAS